MIINYRTYMFQGYLNEKLYGINLKTNQSDGIVYEWSLWIFYLSSFTFVFPSRWIYVIFAIIILWHNTTHNISLNQKFRLLISIVCFGQRSNIFVLFILIWHSQYQCNNTTWVWISTNVVYPIIARKYLIVCVILIISHMCACGMLSAFFKTSIFCLSPSLRYHRSLLWTLWVYVDCTLYLKW